MTRDPIQPLSDIGRRVLQTARYLTTSHAPDQRLKSYEVQVRDPLVSLSGLCEGLLERLEASPVAAQPEDLPHEPGRGSVNARNPGSAFSTPSRSGVTTDGSDESPGTRRVGQVTGWAGTPGPELGTPSTYEGSRRSIDDPTPSPDRPDHHDPWETPVSRGSGEEAPQTESPQSPPGPEVARRLPRSRDLRYPVRRLPDSEHPAGPDGGPYLEESESELPVRKEWPEGGQAGFANVPESDVPVKHGQASWAAESVASPQGSRLTASTERLAAMLRSHVEEPTQTESRDGGDAFPGSQGDGERGDSHHTGRTRTQPAGPVDVEEIMERLADELESEFVRTYGRSGG
jgi:hypothetical protein